MNSKQPPESVEAIFRRGTPIDDALHEAAREALLRHKRGGQPIAVWRDGKVALIAAKDIRIPRRRKK